MATVQKLLGDFFESNAQNNRERMASTLKELEVNLERSKDVRESFAGYFAEIYSGRSFYNTMINVEDYPIESVVRELFQNAFDCQYAESDYKLAVTFKDNGYISFAYNERGFSLEQFIYYMSFGRNVSDNPNREGHFGVGAKSVFMNVQELTMRSNIFRFNIKNRDGMLEVTDISVDRPLFLGTEVTFQVPPEVYARIHDNFLTMDSKKGDFLNMPEVVFAFLKKKIPDDKAQTEEIKGRTLNIAIVTGEELNMVYTVANHVEDDHTFIRFFKNREPVADFISHEKDGMSVIFPYRIIDKAAEGVVSAKNNLFATYELTGLITRGDDEGKVPAWVSLPTRFINVCRAGIRQGQEKAAADQIRVIMTEFIKANKWLLILNIVEANSPDGGLRFEPEFEAFSYIHKAVFGSPWKGSPCDAFMSYLTLKFPDTKPVPYAEIRVDACLKDEGKISYDEHESGEAQKEYIDRALEKLKARLPDITQSSFYVSYSYDDFIVSKRVFLYEFRHGGHVWRVTSESTGDEDFELYNGFRKMSTRLTSRFVKNAKVPDETSLETILTLYDKLYTDKYEIDYQLLRFYLTGGGETEMIDVTGIAINSLKAATDSLRDRQARFTGDDAFYNSVARMTKEFARGKTFTKFISDVREQGVAADYDERRKAFNIFGIPIPLSDDIPCNIVWEILPEKNRANAFSMFKGRELGLDLEACPYTFDLGDLGGVITNPASVIEKTAFADFGFEKYALLDADGKVIEIVNGDAQQIPTCETLVLLTNEHTKRGFCGMLELVAFGEKNGAVSKTVFAAKGLNHGVPKQPVFTTVPADKLTELSKTAVRLYDGDDAMAAVYAFATASDSRYPGYGTTCPVSGAKLGSVQHFTISGFDVLLPFGNKERSFSIALYMCQTIAEETAAWYPIGLTIGGKDPFVWLEQVKANGLKSENELPLKLSFTERTEINEAIVVNERTLSVKLSALNAALIIALNS
ncbi:MAG: hypothetical protein LBN40_00775 [Oscillospiraceae bacterium]|jgi:hypothetical protein|nr:hypothetical protein [Oscillospiraceae bacterium]